MSDGPLPQVTTPLLRPGTLWSKVVGQTDKALNCGALQPIPTTYEVVEQGNIHFIVRAAANLVRKNQVQRQQVLSTSPTNQDFNPFLPPEPNLFVTDLSETHLVILNKFQVVNHHLLIITRRFEDQQNWLTLTDFAALSACMAEFEGLAFYNAGPWAGASQRHKHLQMIPLPMVMGEIGAPIESVVPSINWQGAIGTIPDFPFIHAIARLDGLWTHPAYSKVQALLNCYLDLLGAVGWQMHGHQSKPYNLLVTRRWMLIVPRSQESFGGIAINSLGFAGSLFVRNKDQMRQLKQIGPLSILKGVAISD